MTVPAAKRARKRTPPKAPAKPAAPDVPEQPTVMTPEQAFGVLAQAAAAFNGNQQQHMTIITATQVLAAHFQPKPNRASRRAALKS